MFDCIANKLSSFIRGLLSFCYESVESLMVNRCILSVMTWPHRYVSVFPFTCALISAASLPADASAASRYSASERYLSLADSIEVPVGGFARGTSGNCVQVADGSVCRAQRVGRTDSEVQATDFGVKCDGTTDDSDAILSATNAAVRLGGLGVVFPTGRCLLRNFILPPSRTHWVAYGETVIIFDPAMPLGGKSRAAIAFENVSDIIIDGLTFEGNGRKTLPCQSGCAGSPHIQAINASNITIRNSTFRDFGDLTQGSDGKQLAYVQGLVAFGGKRWLVENSRFINNSGDGAAWSNGTDGVEVRESYFSGNGDSSGPVCTIGGSNFNIHHNEIHQRRGNTAPIIVMDRCNNWKIDRNRIYGVANPSGRQTGQGIRVARYTLESSAFANHDFSITGNAIHGTETAISVESSGTLQAGYTDANTGQIWPAVRVPGGGRFAVVGNTSTGAGTCIQISDSEAGSISGNTCSKVADTGLLLISYTSMTGSFVIGRNTFSGLGSAPAGSFGVRQLAAGAAISPVAMTPQSITGFRTPMALIDDKTLAVLPRDIRLADESCGPGETNLMPDWAALKVCSAHGAVRSEQR